MPPGTPPPTLRIINCSARPIVAFALLPCPNALMPEFIPICLATGPLTTMTGEEKYVVHSSPCIQKRSCNAASTLAITIGKYSGLQPAMTALIAIFSIEQGTLSGGTLPIISAASRSLPFSIRITLKGVGGTTGRPSLQPLSKQASMISSASANSTARACRICLPKRSASTSSMPGSCVFDPQPGLKSMSSAPSSCMPVKFCHCF